MQVPCLLRLLNGGIKQTFKRWGWGGTANDAEQEHSYNVINVEEYRVTFLYLSCVLWLLFLIFHIN